MTDLIRRAALAILSPRTLQLLRFDAMKVRGRIRRWGARRLVPAHRRLHFGCGSRKIAGWLNVDLVGSDFDLDLTGGRLPWRDGAFEAALAQHVIEHLELRGELIPLLVEVRRVLSPGGELWLSCPDIEKLSASYLQHRMTDLIEDRERRSKLNWDCPWTLEDEVGLPGVPGSHMMNSIFFQGHEHRNLFDFRLLEWTLQHSGFARVERVDEAALLERFPEVPVRSDDAQSLYVRAFA